MSCPSVISLFPLSLNKCQASLDVIDGEPQQCMRQQSYISLLHGGGGRAQSLTESYHLSLRPPSLRSNLASAAHYQPAVAHLTQISAQESTLKKTKLREKKILTLVYIFQVVLFRRHCAAAFQPCKVLLWAFGLTFKLFLQCANLLCVGEVTVPPKTHCVLQCGGISQTGMQWDALQGPTVELMLSVC